MEFKGTKGQWYLQQKTDAYTNIIRCNNGTNSTIYLAATSQFDGQECRYNAKLMSKSKELLEKLTSILNMSEDRGVAGCTWGDTEMSSTDVAYGYNLALENVKSGLEELINSATTLTDKDQNPCI